VVLTLSAPFLAYLENELAIDGNNGCYLQANILSLYYQTVMANLEYILSIASIEEQAQIKQELWSLALI
jgi:hypothetical protein